MIINFDFFGGAGVHCSEFDHRYFKVKAIGEQVRGVGMVNRSLG